MSEPREWRALDERAPVVTVARVWVWVVPVAMPVPVRGGGVMVAGGRVVCGEEVVRDGRGRVSRVVPEAVWLVRDGRSAELRAKTSVDGIFTSRGVRSGSMDMENMVPGCQRLEALFVD